MRRIVISCTVLTLGVADLARCTTVWAQDVTEEAGRKTRPTQAVSSPSSAKPSAGSPPTGAIPPPQGTPAPSPSAAPSTPRADHSPKSPARPSEPAERKEQDDHRRVVGHVGLGFFGVSLVPAGRGDIKAPSLGFRYWLNDAGKLASFLRRIHVETVALEAAVGLGIDTASDTTGGKTVKDSTSVAVVLHAATPLAFAHSSHFTFIAVPEINFAFSTGSAGDDHVSGVLFALGIRAGAEIQFGFMGIPELSLQGTLGLGLRYTGRSQGQDGSTAFNFATSVQGTPWDIFTGNVAAIYYLP